MPHIVRTSRGPRCQSSKGKFVKNSKCGLALGDISRHLGETLAGLPTVCITAKKGGTTCHTVRKGSKSYKLKSGGTLKVTNKPAGSRQSRAKANFSKGSQERKRKFKVAAKACKGSGNFRCCMSKQLGDGKAKACKAGGGTTRKAGAKKSGTRKASAKGGRTKQQSKFAAAAKKCKGSKDYRGCMSKALKG